MSPLLFDYAADALAIMIDRALTCGIITGLGERFVEGGAAILQYADDTILLLQNNFEQARNLKFILCLFEQLSGLKLIFTKVRFIVLDGRKKERWNLKESSPVKVIFYL
jgi:hypothetical protein